MRLLRAPFTGKRHPYNFQNGQLYLIGDSYWLIVCQFYMKTTQSLAVDQHRARWKLEQLYVDTTLASRSLMIVGWAEAQFGTYVTTKSYRFRQRYGTSKHQRTWRVWLFQVIHGPSGCSRYIELSQQPRKTLIDRFIYWLLFVQLDFFINIDYCTVGYRNNVNWIHM